MYWDAVGPLCISQFALSVVTCVHEQVLLASKLQFRFWPLVTEIDTQSSIRWVVSLIYMQHCHLYSVYEILLS